jgi:hypothetical protein
MAANPDAPPNNEFESFLSSISVSGTPSSIQPRRHEKRNRQAIVSGLCVSICATLGAFAVCLAWQPQQNVQGLALGLVVATVATVFIGLIGQAVALLWALQIGDSFLTALGSLGLTAGNLMLLSFGDSESDPRGDRGNPLILAQLGGIVASILATSITGPLGVFWENPQFVEGIPVVFIAAPLGAVAASLIWLIGCIVVGRICKRGINEQPASR